MYEAYFGLANLPFCITPDSRFYVDVAPHRAAIRALQDGFGHDAEFMPLVGEFGAGKTTVGRRMLEEVDRARHVAAELPSVRIEGDQLFDRVAEALGMRRAGAIPPLGGVIRHLEGLVRDGCDALLLVDEAHQLDIATLRRLRKLTAVRVEGRAALHVCLVGRSTPPGIGELQRIGQPLSIGAPVRVEPLDAAGTHEYILERLGRAGWMGRPAFDETTTAAIHERCKGNPGRVNRLCRHILLQLYLQGRDDVNADIVRAVDELLQAELNGEPATLALPPLVRAPPGPDTLAEAPAAVSADAGLDTELPMAPLATWIRPPMRPPDAGLVVPRLEAQYGAHGFRPRRRGLVQGVAALALLASGGFLWQMISNLATARSEATRYAAAAAASVAATAPAAHGAAPMRAARTSSTPLAPQTAPTTSPSLPIPATAGLAAVAEQAISRSPTGAGPTTPATPVATAPVARPVAALVAPRSATARRAGATGDRGHGHRLALPAYEPRAESTATASASPVAATVACTLEGETLGLCNRSRARAPVRVAAPAPALDPAFNRPAEASRTPPPRPSCEPTRAALGLCPQSSSAAR